ncbi:unnamed protein product [Brassica oleracea var. botrytis]
MRFVKESGANKGCKVIVSGKLRAQGFKSMKFKDGYIVPSGQPTKDYIDSTVKHVLLIQGLLGIKVKAMLDWDPKGSMTVDHRPRLSIDGRRQQSIDTHFVVSIDGETKKPDWVLADLKPKSHKNYQITPDEF